MQISYDTATNQIRQWGNSLGDLDGCAITDVSDEESARLSEDGMKVYNPNDGTITVTPPDTSAEDAARAAAEAEKQAAQQTQLTAARALIDTSSNQQQADAMTAFMRTLGLPL